MTAIQFIRGTDEEVTPKVRLTRSRSGDQGTAEFTFENPKAFSQNLTKNFEGMYMIDEEGEITCLEVKAKFVNGEPKSLFATYVMKSQAKWDRFMRFMERYATEYGLEFNKT